MHSPARRVYYVMRTFGYKLDGKDRKQVLLALMSLSLAKKARLLPVPPFPVMAGGGTGSGPAATA